MKRKILNNRVGGRVIASVGAVTCGMLIGGASQATELYSNGDTTLNWANTIKYSAVSRVKSQDPVIQGVGNANGNDGDDNFGKGLVSSRVDILSELTLRSGNQGFRLVGAGWYDNSYAGGNDGTLLTSNCLSGPGNFCAGTVDLQRSELEVLDAFAYGNYLLGGKSLSVKIGRFAEQWGESLFSPTAISAAR